MTGFPAPSSAVSPWSLIMLMVLLAGLDLLGAMLAKEWTSARSPWVFVAGAVSFVLLFAVFALGLRYAELSTVTFGWIIGVQAGVLIIERVRYGVQLPTGKWVAIVLIIGLQAYLVLAPSVSGDATEQTEQRQVELVAPD
jgi:hypothetical protein